VRRILLIVFSAVLLARPAAAGTVLFQDFKGDFSVWSLDWLGQYGNTPNFGGLGFGGSRGSRWSLFDNDDLKFGHAVGNLLDVLKSSDVDVVALILVSNTNDHSKHAGDNKRDSGNGRFDDRRPGYGGGYGNGRFDTPGSRGDGSKPGGPGGSYGGRFDKPPTNGSTSVPEPSSLALLLTAGLAMVAGRGRMTPR
jgi:hypothetical protein